MEGKLEWKKVVNSEKRENFVLESPNGYYISFAPNPTSTIFGVDMAELVRSMGGNNEDRGTPETALYASEGDKLWRILDGDFRAEYEAAFPDWEASLAVYNKYKKDHRSSWSTDDE